VTGCALFQAGKAPIYQDDVLTVQLEPNPVGDGSVTSGLEPLTISTPQLAEVLRGVRARKVTSWLQSVINQTQPEQLFQETELPLVARELHNGLKAASAGERVSFRLLRSVTSKSREETSGAVFVRGGLLYLTLTKFRYSGDMSYEGAEGGSGKDIEAIFEPPAALAQRPQGFATRWLGADRPETIVDVRLLEKRSAQPQAVAVPERAVPSTVAATPATPALEPVQPAQATKGPDPSELIAELKSRLVQLEEENASVRAELARLRQELAETKQLVGEKELELSRLKSKSKRSGKGKK